MGQYAVCLDASEGIALWDN